MGSFELIKGGGFTFEVQQVKGKDVSRSFEVRREKTPGTFSFRIFFPRKSDVVRLAKSICPAGPLSLPPNTYMLQPPLLLLIQLPGTSESDLHVYAAPFLMRNPKS